MFEHPELLAACAAVFGAIVGSYLNVVIFRTCLRIEEDIAREEAQASEGAEASSAAAGAALQGPTVPGPTVLSPTALQSKDLGRRSVCVACGAPISWYWNIPILGWLALRGRAACCGARISVGYPVVEALTAALFALLAYSISDSPRLGSGSPWLLLILHAFMVSNLVANGLIDLRTKYLATGLMHGLIVAGLVGGFVIGPTFAGGLPSEFTAKLAPGLAGLMASAAGAACGWALTFSIRGFGTALFGQEAMGSGDVKLMAGVGAFLGWPGALLTFFLASLTGAIGGLGGRFVGLDTQTIAFGPYLALGALLVLFGGEPLMHFSTVTLPEWQASFASDPRIAVAVVVVCSILLWWVVRQGRSRRIEES